MRRAHVRLAVLVLGAFFLAGHSGESAAAQSPATTPQASQSAPESEVPGRFVDITEKAGVHFQHYALHTSRKYLLETMGSGVALFDCDNDGRLDLYLVNGAPYTDPTPRASFRKRQGLSIGIACTTRKPTAPLRTSRRSPGSRGLATGWASPSPTTTTMDTRMSLLPLMVGTTSTTTTAIAPLPTLQTRLVLAAADGPVQPHGSIWTTTASSTLW